MTLFIKLKANTVPFFIVLKLLAFIGIGFVGKPTKQMNGYDKQADIGTMDGDGDLDQATQVDGGQMADVQRFKASALSIF